MSQRPCDLADRVACLLERGQFLLDPGWPRRVAGEADPLLVESMHEASDRGLAFVEVDPCGGRGGPRLHLVTDSKMATEILQLGADSFRPSTGPLRSDFFGSAVPPGGDSMDSVNERRARWRSFHERMFAFRGHESVCPIARASSLSPCEMMGGDGLFATPAFDVIRAHLDRHFSSPSAIPPRSPQDFLSLKSLASVIVFGSDESDLLADTVLASERSGALRRCGGAGVSDGRMEDLRRFVVGTVMHPPPGTLVSVGRDLARSTDPGLHVGELGFQALGWFTALTTLLCVTLPTSLSILCADPDSLARAERESTDGEFDPGSECTFLNAVPLETLRLYSPVSALGRTASEGITLSDGTVVADGARLVLPFETYLRDPRCYARPNAFDPDRCSAASQVSPLCQDVFSTGTRTCPGRRAVLFVLRYALFLLLRRYVYRAASDTTPPFADLDDMPDVVDTLGLAFDARERGSGCAWS